MKHARVFWLASLGILLFAIGLFISLNYYFVRSAFLVTGAALVLLFYFTTIFEVIRSPKLRPSRRIFWLIAIICIPVMGNLLYILAQDLMNSKQTPHLQNF